MDHAVAIIVEGVPIVFALRRGDFVLRVSRGALHGDQIALLDARAALRSGNLGFTIADGYFCLSARIHINSVRAAISDGMNGNIRRVDFHVSLVALVHAEVGEAFAELQLNLRALERGDCRLRAICEAQNIGEVELYFSAALVAGRDFVARS